LARVTDPNLVNPWGISFSPTGPFWFADNGAGVSDLLDGRGQPVPLVVTVPGSAHATGAPTGTVFNSGAGFAVSENGVSQPSQFLFATVDGTISGWAPALDPIRAVTAVDNSSLGAVYTGLALATDQAEQSFLYAADVRHGSIDMFDQDFRPVSHPGAFQDPNLPSGFIPFNIQNIDNVLMVAYVPRQGAGGNLGASAVRGVIDIYNTDGTFVRRFASGGDLNAPWGLALAPPSFGRFGGALLVGNNGDGHINAYDPATGVFLGQLTDDQATPITLPDLWALTFGNDHEGGASDTLFFAAGLNDQHGLFGAIQPPQRLGADTGGSGTFNPTAPGERADYPLPPSSDPGLQGRGDDQPLPISILLPLTESSLALAPTLSTVTQQGGPAMASTPASPMLAAVLDRSVASTLLASGTAFILSADYDGRPARDTQDSLLPLNTFLDLNASASAFGTDAPLQQPAPNVGDVVARSLPSPDGNAGPAYPLTASAIETEATRLGVEQGAEAPASGPGDSGVARASSVGRPQSTGGGAERTDAPPAPSWSGWPRLPKGLLLLVTLPVAWSYLQKRRSWSQRSGGERCCLTKANET
jgi:uncharacterized protein (TIGR03118 family)